MMKNIINKNKGVTLVSLAIVITVLLILTGVIIYNVRDSLGISNLQGMQNDIQNLRDLVNDYYATNGQIPAKLKYTNEGNIEKIKNAGVISEKVDIGDFYIIDLAELENLTLNYGEDYKNISDATTEEEASQYEDIYIINETSQNIFYVAGIQVDNEWFYTDYTSDDVDKVAVNLRYFDGVKIPEGFYYVGGTKDEGLVISDVIGDDLDNSKHGNQFVWVPVDNYSEFVRIEGYENGVLQSYLTNSGEANETGINAKITESATTQNEAQEMYESVKNYGGFYIGRYEAGKDTSGKVVTQKGVDVYNNVTWSKNTQMNEELETENTQDGAIELARSFDDIHNYTSVTSTLTYGVQWDAIMRWMQNEPNLTGGKYVQDSTGMGWYNYNFQSGNSTHKTGINLNGGDNKVKNIYDLAGNVWEWTMESYNTDCRIYRGNSYAHMGDVYPVSNRLHAYPSLNNYDDLGFRVALYLNSEEKWSPKYDVEGTYTDKNGDTATIPAGFQVSETKGETLIDEGLVIRDEEGNEFVWIPVDGILGKDGTIDDIRGKNGEKKILLGRYEFDISGVPSEYSGDYIDENAKDTENLLNYGNTIAKDIEGFKDSVRKNKGYYIARFEASQNINNKAESKYDKEVWNNLTQQNAALACQDLYTEINSDLINSYAWDTAILFIQKHGQKDYSRQTSLNSSKQNTGMSNDIQLNIYDMTSNCHEFTTETTNNPNEPCASRGGDYGSDTHYTSGRYDNTVNGASIYYSFRSILYF